MEQYLQELHKLLLWYQGCSHDSYLSDEQSKYYLREVAMLEGRLLDWQKKARRLTCFTNLE
jgi:hypothetical protein